jgi:hypothetical protein
VVQLQRELDALDVRRSEFEAGTVERLESLFSGLVRARKHADHYHEQADWAATVERDLADREGAVPRGTAS